jgi:hypothetical protein
MKNRFVMGLFAAVLFAGCGQEVPLGQGQIFDTAKDSIRILNITPDVNEELNVGDTITLEVEAEYSLVSNDSASITLVVQVGESGQMPLANEVDVIKKGHGSITISTRIDVPSTKAIQIFTPLTVQGAVSTSVVDSRICKVKQ